MTEPDDMDLLAAEYVLGTLDHAERAEVSSRMTREPDLARAVDGWHERLSPLTDAVPDVAPPAELFDAIVARLFDGEGRDGDVVVLRRHVRRWRAATGALAAVAAGLVAWIAVHGEAAPPRDRFVAVLQRDAGSPAMVLDVDLAGRRLSVRSLAPPSAGGKAYELWIIDPALGSPRSLGLVPPRGGGEASLTRFGEGVITDATYAVTVEPSGGSPSGLPTSTPILSGKLLPVPR